MISKLFIFRSLPCVRWGFKSRNNNRRHQVSICSFWQNIVSIIINISIISQKMLQWKCVSKLKCYFFYLLRSFFCCWFPCGGWVGSKEGLYLSVFHSVNTVMWLCSGLMKAMCFLPNLYANVLQLFITI